MCVSPAAGGGAGDAGARADPACDWRSAATLAAAACVSGRRAGPAVPDLDLVARLPSVSPLLL